MRPFLQLIPLLLLCVSCNCNYLTIRTDYLSVENLASYHACTPDPLLNDPPVGQEFIVSWFWLPRSILALNNLHIHVILRFYDREEVELNIPIGKATGSFVYTVLDEEFCKTGGILTYKAEFVGGGEVLEEHRQQLWTNLIKFDSEEP